MLLSGKDLEAAIARVLGGKRQDCEVAFWGRGAASLLGDPGKKAIRVICNLASGGTNPNVIAQLMQKGIEVRQCDRLHAKVYLGDKEAVVTSANASINGLGLEGAEQALWIETGVVIEAKSARAWFKQLWDSEQCRPISKADLNQARAWFQMRSRRRPTRRFEDFDPTAEDLILFSWCHTGDDPIMDEKGVQKAFGGSLEMARERISYGIDLFGAEDCKIPANTWGLFYYLTLKGRPGKSYGLLWTCLGGPDAIAKQARDYEDGKPPCDVMLRVEEMPPVPFKIDQRVKDAVFEVLSWEKYADISDQEWGKGSFYTKKRKARMRVFIRRGPRGDGRSVGLVRMAAS